MTELATKTLSKEEFIYWTNWISMRWPSVKNDPNQLKSLYEDFSHFNDEIIGQAAVEQLDQGSEFFSWPKLKKRCKEIYFEELKQRIDQAKTQKHKQHKPCFSTFSVLLRFRLFSWPFHYIRPLQTEIMTTSDHCKPK